MDFSNAQLKIIQAEVQRKTFLHGPAGTGKTTAAVARLRFLLDRGLRADSILLLTPQRTLHEPYLDSLARDPYTGGEVTPATIGGLARRMTDLFWPLVAEAAGFAHPDRAPIFLTLETAQYYMAHLARPLLDEGFFSSITIDRNRLYSQILDNLNKAAAVGFPHTEIGERLDSAWVGDPAQRRVYQDAQECANRFRAFCLENNLLDFSLQLEIFANFLWREPIVRDYLTRTYRYLIYDNLEEDVPRAHDLIRAWLSDFDSALLIYDDGGGFRQFLGADPETALSLCELCDETIAYEESYVMSGEVLNLDTAITAAIKSEGSSSITPADYSPALNFIYRQDAPGELPRFYPELLDSIVGQIRSLIADEGAAPSDIVILAPYLSDALRFALMNRLTAAEIPNRSHRPSRSLRDEPASHALLTLSALAHPQWNIHPPRFDAAYALMQAIDGLDLIRAQLLTEIVYRMRDFSLAPFDNIKSDVQERITFLIGGRYSVLRDWLLAYREGEALPLDHFLRKLFGEVLSQPGFGFHRNFDSIRVAASLIESVKKFRQALEPLGEDVQSLGREYIATLEDGILAAQYLESWRTAETDAVLVAPAYTFLMMNRAVRFQFWLDIGSSGWVERLFQPLTHPYVLSRAWPPGRLWTDANDVEADTKALTRLVSGLLHRCRERVYLGLSDLGEAGFEQRGALMRAFQKILQNAEA